MCKKKNKHECTDYTQYVVPNGDTFNCDLSSFRAKYC